jgi:hypothetical protein
MMIDELLVAFICRMYICMYVCTYACMYALMYIRTYVLNEAHYSAVCSIDDASMMCCYDAVDCMGSMYNRSYREHWTLLYPTVQLLPLCHSTMYSRQGR